MAAEGRAPESEEQEFRARLAVEMQGWQREGLVSGEQAAAILARYNTPASAARALRLGPVAGFVAVLGAIALGAGVVLFFAANWTVLPAWFKVLLVFSGTAAAYAGGYSLSIRTRLMPRVGGALLLLGALLYQAGLFLLAQIYHMPTDNPTLFLLGALGVLPLAYAISSRPALVLGLGMGLIWVAWQIAERLDGAFAAFAVGLTYLLIGVIIYAGGPLHRYLRVQPSFSAVYEIFGLAMVLALGYWHSFGWWWEEVHRQIVDHPERVQRAPLWFAGVAVLALSAALALLLRPMPGERWAREQVVEVAVLALTTAIATLAAFVPDLPDVYPLLFNLLFFGTAILVVVKGYWLGQPRFINIGIPFLAVGLLTRYVDTFWSLLPRSAFWITGGVLLLLVAAAMERLRQRLLAGPAPAVA